MNPGLTLWVQTRILTHAWPLNLSVRSENNTPMVQVDKRSHLVLFKQNQRNHNPYTSELQKAYKTDYLVNKHNMMGTVSKLYVPNNTWIYVCIKNLTKFQLQFQLSRLSTPIPTPGVSTPTPTPASLLNINSNSNSGSFNSNSGKSLEYQLQLQLRRFQLQFQFQLQLRSWSWSWTQLQLRSWPQPCWWYITNEIQVSMAYWSFSSSRHFHFVLYAGLLTNCLILGNNILWILNQSTTFSCNMNLKMLSAKW